MALCILCLRRFSARLGPRTEGRAIHVLERFRPIWNSMGSARPRLRTPPARHDSGRRALVTSSDFFGAGTDTGWHSLGHELARSARQLEPARRLLFFFRPGTRAVPLRFQRAGGLFKSGCFVWEGWSRFVKVVVSRRRNERWRFQASAQIRRPKKKHRFA